MPCSTAQAEHTLPARQSWWKVSQASLWLWAPPLAVEAYRDILEQVPAEFAKPAAAVLELL